MAAMSASPRSLPRIVVSGFSARRSTSLRSRGFPPTIISTITPSAAAVPMMTHFCLRGSSVAHQFFNLSIDVT